MLKLTIGSRHPFFARPEWIRLCTPADKDRQNGVLKFENAIRSVNTVDPLFADVPVGGQQIGFRFFQPVDRQILCARRRKRE